MIISFIERKMNVLSWSWNFAGLILLSVLANGVTGYDEMDLLRSGIHLFPEEDNADVLVVGLTLLHSAAAKGAVCLDGSVPGYHLSRGYGLGATSWIIQLEGGAWCDSIENCEDRKFSSLGSSTKMEKELNFTGILSNKATENPDFYNWNKVKVRYCDGASFSGDSENKEAKLQFRGRRIFSAVIEDLMEKGMFLASQVLLNGCSAGGLAAILRCDDLKSFFSPITKVKCMSDAGFFMDTVDISGNRTLRHMYSGVVNTQGLQNTLPRTCTSHLDPTLCFFPQNIINEVKTPLFILNSAFDAWQVGNSIAPASADPDGTWQDCRIRFRCNPDQKRVLEDFKTSMVTALETFATSRKNGVLINTDWAHCQAEINFFWFNTQTRKGIAVDVGNWYFER